MDKQTLNNIKLKELVYSLVNDTVYLLDLMETKGSNAEEIIRLRKKIHKTQGEINEKDMAINSKEK